MRKNWSEHRYSTEINAGFTLIEMLTTSAIIALLLALALPAMGRARERARSSICLNNLRQLQLAWMNYVDDFSGKLPSNTANNVKGIWRSDFDSWAGSSSARMDRDAENLKQGLFLRLGYSSSLSEFVCPSDDSSVFDQDRQSLGLSRFRSYSMNGSLGGRESEIQPVIHDERQISAPSGLFVFIDEHEDSIDDGHFLVWPYPDDRWVNLPTDRHDGSGTLSFADGHVERWKWLERKSFEERESYWKQAKTEADIKDLRRLQSVDFSFSDFKNYRPQK